MAKQFVWHVTAIGPGYFSSMYAVEGQGKRDVDLLTG